MNLQTRRRSLISAIIGAILAYAALPACAAYFLNYWRKTCGSISATIIRVSSAIGIIGLAFLVGLLWYMITYVPPPTSPYHDNFMNFNPADVLIMLVGLFYGAILLPAIGFVFLARGLEYPENIPGSWILKTMPRVYHDTISPFFTVDNVSKE